MVGVRLEVRTGTARFRVSVRTSSVQRAVSLTGATLPGGTASILSQRTGSADRLAAVGGPPTERMAA